MPVSDPASGGRHVIAAPDLVVPAAELAWRFSTPGGPGGQHANTAHTRTVVTWDIDASKALTDRQRTLLIGQLGSQVTVSVNETRSQARNRDIAIERLAALISDAVRVERPRKPTKPSRSARKRRVDSKRRRSQVKANRRHPRLDD